MIDGHDVSAVLAALDRAKATKGRPQAILARTIKGHGFSLVAGKEDWHGKAVFEGRNSHEPIKEIGGAPVEVPPDPGKSYARTSLPEAAGFSGARRAGLRGRQAGRNARGLRLCAQAARRA